MVEISLKDFAWQRQLALAILQHVLEEWIEWPEVESRGASLFGLRLRFAVDLW